MKKVILIVGLVIAWQFSEAQTFAEWFKQKKTQIKYLGQQIAALEAYKDFLEKGYSIAKDGCSLINDIKHGDFDLHKNYFASLDSVKPALSFNSKTSVLLDNAVEIINTLNQMLQTASANKQYSTAEWQYLKSVANLVMSECERMLADLAAVTTEGSLVLKDDERVSRMEKIGKDFMDQRMFVKAFADETAVLGLQRSREMGDVGVMKKLYGL